ncbi:unnamed protein product [Pneumocystis jirovecii]|uniref:Tuberin N-terminal domain-containing protein n=1 Tax=Pneumocystis jirovecii TaxID=42068 RepID=L0PED8_PNEJI|nr:unnamed protein product [Pneumocystis jirovecii]
MNERMNAEARPLFSGKGSRLFSTFRNLGRPKKSLLNVPESPLIYTLRSSHIREEVIQAAECLSQALGQIVVINAAEIWMAGKALISGENDLEMRRSGFLLMAACIKAQAELSAVDRYMFYQDIRQHHVNEDFAMCLDIMGVLTNDGRDITAMESDIMRLLYKLKEI